MHADARTRLQVQAQAQLLTPNLPAAPACAYLQALQVPYLWSLGPHKRALRGSTKRQGQRQAGEVQDERKEQAHEWLGCTSQVEAQVLAGSSYFSW